MRGRHSRSVALAALLPLLAGGPAAQALEPGGADSSAEVGAGVQGRTVRGSLEKFQEYRDVRRGFLLDDLRLDLGATGRSHLEFDARDALQEDASYQLTTGRHGKYRLSVVYDATPHTFSGGRFLWSGFGTGRLQIAGVAQAQLQANEQTQVERGPGSTDPNQDTTGEDAIQQNIVRGLYDASDDVVFRLKREQTGAAFEYALSENVSAWVRVMNENRRGARVISAGSYERWSRGSGLAHIQDRFNVIGQDLAEPIDYRTTSVAAGAGVHRERWAADLDYTFTQFRNFNDVLRWDNPFRLEDASASGATGAFDRGGFAVGQLGLPPNSQSHDVSASGAVDLPMRGKLAASLGFGLVTQNDPFVPYTLNSAIQASDETGPLGPAAELALPRRDLGGEVMTWAGNLSLSLHPVEAVGVSARYRLNRYDGRTPHLTFPGYSGFGDSFWRRVKNDPGAEVENDVFDFTRHDADLRVDMRVLEPLTVNVQGGWEGNNFSGLRIGRMSELAAGAGVLYLPARSTRLNVNYRYSDRGTTPYVQGATRANPEARGLVNFNWAERRRHQADVRLNLSPAELVSFGVSVRAADERYSGDSAGTEEIDRFRFGRTHVQSATGAADVVVHPIERLSLYASYAREYRQEQMANAAKDDAVKDPLGLGDQFTSINHWSSNLYERVNTVGAGASVELVPERLVLDAAYNLSSSDLDINTFNPNGVSSTTLLNAVANDWPRISNRLHEVSAQLGYQISPNVRAGVRYLFDWYTLDDFVWNDLEPYMAGATPENSTRFLFADATYRNYLAHVGSVWVTGRF